MDTPCLRWPRHCNANGYGTVKIAGKMELAHRVAYCDANGLRLEDIKGLSVRHKCDTPACFNPEHLELGTHQDNMRDKQARGRQTRGASHPRAKLSDADVAAMRAEYIPKTHTHGAAALGRKYGISGSQADRIVKGQSWTP